MNRPLAAAPPDIDFEAELPAWIRQAAGSIAIVWLLVYLVAGIDTRPGMVLASIGLLCITSAWTLAQFGIYGREPGSVGDRAYRGVRLLASLMLVAGFLIQLPATLGSFKLFAYLLH